MGVQEDQPDLLPIPVSTLPKAAPRLSVVIGVAGWVTCADDFVGVWQHVGSSDCERFALVWETEELIELNSGIMKFVASLVGGRYALHWLCCSVCICDGGIGCFMCQCLGH